MTTAELTVFGELLARFCEEELDQFEHWRVSTKYGDVFVDISRYPAAGTTADAYDAFLRQ